MEKTQVLFFAIGLPSRSRHGESKRGRPSCFATCVVSPPAPVHLSMTSLTLASLAPLAALFPAQGVSIGSTERYVPHAHTIPRGTHRGECVRLRARLHSPVVSFALGLLRFVRSLASSFTSHRKGSQRNMMAGGAPHG